MKKLFFLFFFFLQLSFAQAQKIARKDQLIKTVNDIGKVIADRYHPDKDSVSNTCWNGCVFVRFKIDKDRQLTDIDYTNSTPIFIKDALEKAFATINMEVKTINKLPLSGHDDVYILPVMIYNNQGCGFMTGWEDKNYKPDPKTETMFEIRQSRYRQSGNSIANILNFTKTRLDSLNCILLAPVMAGGLIVY